MLQPRLVPPATTIAPIITYSPWAKLYTWVTLAMITNPSATSA